MARSYGRVLALDVGSKTVGVAVSDPTGTTAQPLETLRREPQGKELAAIAELVARLQIKEVVVGLPTRTDGREGPEARRVKEFVRHLQRVVGIPVVLVDERFSTREAERMLLDADLSRSRRRGVLNHVAAAIILDTYLARRQVRATQGKDTLPQAGGR
ncbi:MAG: Holliday junction resolvase RuvX [Bacillota bacterium]